MFVLLPKTLNAILILPKNKMVSHSRGGKNNICWCNPPYGREISKWVKKAYTSSKDDGTTVVMLLPARTDTKWFHEYIYNKSEIRFIKGRLKFGDSKNSAPFPSMVVVFRPQQKEKI